MDHRSPLESIFNVIGGLPQSHDKPVKQALYNAVAIFLLFLCVAACWALYLILEPFMKPLMWALLVGSALHPIKHSLRDVFRNWFKSLELTNTPAIIGILLLPLNIFNELSEFIGQILLSRLKLIIVASIAIPASILLYHYTPGFIIGLIWNAVVYSYKSLNLVLSITTAGLFILLVIGYVTVLLLRWTPENNTKFHYASTVIWLLGSCCLAQQFNTFQVPIFLLLQVVFFGGFVSEVYEVYRALNDAGQPISLSEAFYYAFHEKPVDAHITEESINEKEKLDEAMDDKDSTSPNLKRFVNIAKLEHIGDTFSLQPDQQSKETDQPSELHTTSVTALKNKMKPTFQRSLSQPQLIISGRLKNSKLWTQNKKLYFRKPSLDLSAVQSYESTFYLYSVLWACIFMIFWKNTVLIPLLLLPILFYVIKHLGIWKWLYDNVCGIAHMVIDWCSVRHDALVPVPMRGLYKIIHKVNKCIMKSIEESIDTVSSLVVILALIVFMICGSIFIVLQIYSEAIMMIQMTTNVINQTVVHNPELRQLLPPTWDDTMDSLLDNAYQYGREGISKLVKSMMTNVDTIKSDKLENQVLELWDRVYQSWMSVDNGNGPQVTPEAVRISWEGFLKDIQKTPEMFNLGAIMEFGKQNVGMLMSLLESVWGLVMGNVSLILGSFGTFLSVILGGGTAVLNFILNVVVFLTTLFYLLNSSGDLYKPVELLTRFSPSGRRFGHALEGAVNGVFSASLKMAAFYGLWTWFIHNLFGVKIVYLPSAVATILGAVPFLGTYWACLPAVLDLWLAQERWIAAVLFAIFQFLPTSVVDTTIYKEIKGSGHPYLTGLAIAGGIFCLGVEGAIIGPLLLCGLYVAIDLSSNLFKETPSEESLNF